MTLGPLWIRSCKPVTGKLTALLQTWSDNDNNMYLGPVVVAQQVLDPSPQNSNPRKEKKGGGGGGAHPLQPSLRSLLQVLGISLPHQGVSGKVFISFNLNFISCSRTIKVVIKPLKGIVASPSLGLGFLGLSLSSVFVVHFSP